MVKDRRILIALGGNLPFGASPPIETLRAAIGAMAEENLEVQRISQLYSTVAFPAGSGPDYVNAAAQLTWRQEVGASGILQALHRIEARFGRERLARWQGRTLDIDLLAIEDSVLPDSTTHRAWRDMPAEVQAKTTPETLILPHPRMQDRAFVLVPLADVAPDWRHPVLGKTVLEMLNALPKPDRDAVVALQEAHLT